MERNIKDLYLEKGNNLTKNELKSRLHQMNIAYDTHQIKKDYFVKLYDEAIKDKKNQLLLEDKLIEDSIHQSGTKNKRTRATTKDSEVDLEVKSKIPKLRQDKEEEGIEKEDVKITETITIRLNETNKNIPSGDNKKADFIPTKIKGTYSPSDFPKPKAEIKTPPIIKTHFIRLKTNDDRKTNQEILNDSITSTINTRVIEKDLSKSNFNMIATNQAEGTPSSTRTKVFTPSSRNGFRGAYDRYSFPQRLDTISERKELNTSAKNTGRLNDNASNGGFSPLQPSVLRMPSMDKADLHPSINEHVTSNLEQIEQCKLTLKPEEGNMRRIIKYLLIGTAAVVVMYGIYKCIANFYTLDTIAIIKRSSNQTANLDENKTVHIERKTTGRIRERIPSDFQTIVSNFINSNKEDLVKVSSLLYTNTISFLQKDYLWYIGLAFVLKGLVHFAYDKYKERQDVNKIYEEIKQKLKYVYEGCDVNFNDGLDLEELTREFSAKYNYSEEYFKENILPQLNEKRIYDGAMKQNEKFYNGRTRIAWQLINNDNI